VPGGPYSSTPFGIFAPIAWNLAGLSRNSLISCSSSTASSAPGDVGERRLGGVLGHELGLGAAELHDAGAAALHVVDEEEEDHQDQQHGDHGEQQAHEPALPRHVARRTASAADSLERPDDLGLLEVDVGRADAVGAVDLDAGLERELQPLVAVDDARTLDATLTDRVDGLGGVDLLVATGRPDDLAEGQEREDGEDDPEDRAAKVALDVHRCGAGAPRPS
jgi:hypothetical protein